MNCPKCGKAVTYDTKFCPECGTRIVQNAEPMIGFDSAKAGTSAGSRERCSQDRGFSQDCGGYQQRGGSQDYGSYQERGGSQERGSYQDRGFSQDYGGYQQRGGSQDRGSYQERGGSQDRGGYQERGDYKERGGYEDRGCNWVVTLLLCIFLGNFGMHSFYTRHVARGVFQILTFGGLGIWTLIDLIRIILDTYRDDKGRHLVR